MYFPFDSVRKSQQVFIDSVLKACQNGEHVLIHAPTGSGKTAGALAPALTYALEKNKKVFFLTSRYTHHKQAMQTIELIQKKFSLQFGVSAIIAKKSLCLQSNIQSLSSTEFVSYCKKLREQGQCSFYTTIRKKDGELTVEGQRIVDLHANSLLDSQQVKEIGQDHHACPYELALEHAKFAKVIIGDYYYIFHPQIRERFLRKCQLDLEDAIIIVDEGHNVIDRLKELASHSLTLSTIRYAQQEAEQFQVPQVLQVLEPLRALFESWLQTDVDQKVISRDFLMKLVESVLPYDEVLTILDSAQQEVLTQRQRSFIQSIYLFLIAWQGEDSGFIRVLSKQKNQVTISYRCLDARLVTKDVFSQAHSVLVMSGTLEPLSFYQDVLGFDRSTKTLSFENPFPKEHALHLIVPTTSTQYKKRSPEQFQNIAAHCATMLEQIPGNCIIFFPSYDVLFSVARYLDGLISVSLFKESPLLTKNDRERILHSFKNQKRAVLLAVTNGSFGEGIDLPGDALRAVIVVGLPLSKPDLETKALIEYYQGVFEKGWEYGYVYPAFNRILQNAGRCIRTPTDKGVIIYLDERYSWPQYKKCIRSDSQQLVTTDYVSALQNFFSQ
ncbi:MAG: ATP-dependent DNA helicase [Candidatus Woesearchaeota archaeon]